MNQVFLSGRCAQEPNVRDVGEQKVVTVRLANNRSYKKGDDWKEETTYVDCEAWGRLAESIANNVRKGTALTVNGRLKTDEWEQDGQKRSKIKVVVNDYELNDAKAKQEAQGQQPVAKGGQKRSNGNMKEKVQDLPF